MGLKNSVRYIFYILVYCFCLLSVASASLTMPVSSLTVKSYLSQNPLLLGKTTSRAVKRIGLVYQDISFCKLLTHINNTLYCEKIALNILSYRYDNLSRLDKIIDSLNQIQSLTYYLSNQVKTETDKRGITTKKQYDKEYRLTQIDKDNITLWTYQYDEVSNKVFETDVNGDITGYQYDALNRQFAINHALAAISNKTYTNIGKLKNEKDPENCITTYGYDDLSRISTKTNYADETTIYKYDEADRLKTVNYTDKTTSYSFDKIYHQTETQNQTDITTYQYDNADRLTQFEVKQADNTQEITTYSLDAVSNRLTEKVTRNSLVNTDKTYHYNSLNQVTKITDNLFQANIDYTYDKNGNTTQKTDNATPTPIITQFEYDSRDQLTQVIRGPPGNPEILGQFDYNHAGQRTQHLKSSRGDVEYFYDGQSVIHEQNITTQTPLAHYTFGAQLLSLTAPDGIQYYHFDGLNSTVNLSDENGSNKVSYSLDPWGHIKNQTGESVNRQIFTGQEHDEKTGLIYFGARYYDPDLPRFINQDSYLGKIITPPSLNRYTYAYHNPTIYYDPNGHFAILANIRDSMNGWAKERFDAAEGLNNTNSYSWLSKGMAAASGLGAGLAEIGASAVGSVNYALNQSAIGYNQLGIVSDEAVAGLKAEVAETHKAAGQVYDTLSSEEGRSRIAKSATDTLSAAMRGETGAIARTTSILAPVPGAAALSATAKMGKAAVNSIKSSKTVINAVEKAKAKAGQAISTTVETGKNVAQKVNHVVKSASNQIGKNAKRIFNGDVGGRLNPFNYQQSFGTAGSFGGGLKYVGKDKLDTLSGMATPLDPKAYSVIFETQISKDILKLRNRGAHFKAANENLLDIANSNKEFNNIIETFVPGFRRVEGKRVKAKGISPSTDTTWHHFPGSDKLQLVWRYQHEQGKGNLWNSLWQKLFHPGNKGGFADSAK